MAAWGTDGPDGPLLLAAIVADLWRRFLSSLV